MLAEAQEIISKHGPDEGEEETAASREASTPASVEPAHETVDEEEKSVTVPSGYNSDSTVEGDDDGDGQGVLGENKAVVLPGQGDNPPPAAGAGDAPGSFSFSFSGASTAEAKSTPVDATVRESDGGSSSSDDDGDEGVEGSASVASGGPGAVVKRPRKARAALTGEDKAAAKAKAAAVMYERALQVAEVLS